MEWALEITRQAFSSPVLVELVERSGEDPLSCFQCAMCGGGCPMSVEMDYTPRQVFRLLQLGLVEEAMRSRAIWLCLTCEACSVRCPRLIDIPKVMGVLREMAVERGFTAGEREIIAFHRSFLDILRRIGRVNEAAIVGEYKLRTGHFFQDLFLAPRMILSGKLRLLPRRSKGQKEVKRIFNKVKSNLKPETFKRGKM